MAKNLVREPGLKMAVPCTSPVTPVAGDPVRYGYRTGLALNDEDASGLTAVAFGSFVATLAVKAVGDGGNSAIGPGDALFYVDADTPKLSKKSSGYFYGFAMQSVSAGATATIEVAHCDAPGTGVLADGGVGTSKLANGAVTEVKIESGSASTGLSGTVAKFAADKNTVGALPVLHRIEIPAGANGNVDVVLEHKTRVVDFWIVLKGAGTAGAAVTLKNGTNAITDAIDCSGGADQAVFRAGKINDATHEVAAAGTLRVSKASTGGDFPGAEAYVLGVRVA